MYVRQTRRCRPRGGPERDPRGSDTCFLRRMGVPQGRPVTQRPHTPRSHQQRARGPVPRASPALAPSSSRPPSRGKAAPTVPSDAGRAIPPVCPRPVSGFPLTTHQTPAWGPRSTRARWRPRTPPSVLSGIPEPRSFSVPETNRIPSCFGASRLLFLRPGQKSALLTLLGAAQAKPPQKSSLAPARRLPWPPVSPRRPRGPCTL